MPLHLPRGHLLHSLPEPLLQVPAAQSAQKRSPSS